MSALRNRIGTVWKSVALIVLNTIALVAVLEAIAAVTLILVYQRREPPPEDVQSYYKGQDWGAAYLREDVHAVSDVRYAPYVMWKTSPYRGPYVQVDDEGNRVTPGSTCTADSYKVFMFGGSTMWGAGVPDWGTIPAYMLAALKASAARPVCVKNFGQPGWVSGQSAIELQHALQTGAVPDLVVFYDGYNDVGVLWSDGVAGGPYQTGNLRKALQPRGIRRTLVDLVVWTHLFRLFEQLDPDVGALKEWPSDYKPPVVDEVRDSSQIVRSYLAIHTSVRALAAAYGFQYAMFWQPSLHDTARHLTEEEQSFVALDYKERPGMAELLRAVNHRLKIEGQSREQLFLMLDLLETVPERVFLDSVHLTPIGNEYVARRMAETLRPSAVRDHR